MRRRRLLLSAAKHIKLRVKLVKLAMVHAWQLTAQGFAVSQKSVDGTLPWLSYVTGISLIDMPFAGDERLL